MGAKWHRVVAENDPDTLLIKDGRAGLGVRLTVPDEVIDQIRAGYQCIECLEPLDESFPERCPLCGFEIRKHQAEVFGAVYKGHVPGARTGPDWDRLADELEERAAQRELRRRLERQGVSVPSIVVPRDL